MSKPDFALRQYQKDLLALLRDKRTRVAIAPLRGMSIAAWCIRNGVNLHDFKAAHNRTITRYKQEQERKGKHVLHITEYAYLDPKKPLERIACRYCGKEHPWSGHSLAAHENKCQALTAHNVKREVGLYRDTLRYLKARLTAAQKGTMPIKRGSAKALVELIQSTLSPKQ